MPNISDTVTTPDGSCPVRFFTPEGQGPWPGVVMIPDAGGFRQTFFDMAATLADSGYAVLLPDVYYRQGDWAPFDMQTAFTDDNERKRLMSFIGSISPDDWASDANAYFDYLSARPEGSGTTFGITGYCMGGRAALTVAGLVPDRVAGAAWGRGGERCVVHQRPRRAAREGPDRGRRRAQDRDLCRRARVRRAGQPVL